MRVIASAIACHRKGFGGARLLPHYSHSRYVLKQVAAYLGIKREVVKDEGAVD